MSGNIEEYRFAKLNGIELKKIKELENEINRRMRVDSGTEIYLMAFEDKDRKPNQATQSHVSEEPTWSPQ